MKKSHNKKTSLFFRAHLESTEFITRLIVKNRWIVTIQAILIKPYHTYIHTTGALT